MAALLLNLLFGAVPALALAWSLAADERRAPDERVVASEGDRKRQSTIFAFVYGLWALTLAMWNWMRGEHPGWILLWLLAGAAALLTAWLLRRRHSAG
ncbi:MAG TPA: hypothetical protein VMT00_14360 [Thermoanaerobaculia bacterium]|nr:hypothetical protein [Thermoanaerobaculia bacterium]